MIIITFYLKWILTDLFKGVDAMIICVAPPFKNLKAFEKFKSLDFFFVK